ncbi:Chromosome initiation inhibitor [Klebsiella michiganensis]|nr:Chromosome initiation inhibitor [Klebsiella michiganensis]
MNKPAPRRCCYRWRSTPTGLATWLLPALSSVLSDSPIRLNLQVEDETRTQERLRRGEVVGAVSIQPQALPSCLVDQLGALDYLFVASKEFAQRYFPNGVTRSALLKAPVVHSIISMICTRPFCSRTSICRRAACPAIS